MPTPETPGTPAPAAPLRQDTRPLEGMLWMVATGLCFVGVAATVKHLGGHVPAAEAAFLRYVLGLVFLIPMLPAMRAEGLSRTGWQIGFWRGGVHTLGVITWFYGMSRLPVAEVAAMNYLTPVFVTLGAVVFFGERLALRRGLAILVAFMGVLVILRPGFREIDPGHLAMLATGVMFGGSYLLAKRMSGQMSPTMVVGLLSLIVPFGLAPFAIAVWVPPTMSDLGWLFLVACLATVGHYTMTLAFRAAPLTVTQPVTFLQLLWSVLVGLLLFGEPIDGFVILGGLVILGAVLFITFREAQLARKNS